MKPEFKATIATDECNFPDVQEGRWSYDAIAAFAKAGFIVGDQYGRFNPSHPITRAEFVTSMPLFEKITVKLANGNVLNIDRSKLVPEKMKNIVDYSEIMKGGNLADIVSK